jgi:hypothetical protein
MHKQRSFLSTANAHRRGHRQRHRRAVLPCVVVHVSSQPLLCAPMQNRLCLRVQNNIRLAAEYMSSPYRKEIKSHTQLSRLCVFAASWLGIMNEVDVLGVELDR